MKYFIALSATILSLSTPFISYAQTQPTQWLSANDLTRLNSDLQTNYSNQCEHFLSGENSEQTPPDWLVWKRSLAIQAEGVYGLFNRYPIQFGKKTISMTLPYRSTWAIDGKLLRPYTIINDKEVRVGQVGFFNVGVQDAVCEIDRSITLRLEKGSVQSLDNALRREIKSGVSDDTNLPTIFMQLNGKSAAIIPTATDNSGGYILRYNRVAVNLPGGYVLILIEKAGGQGTVSSDLLRMAASVKP